jgi:hypothetical protein
VGTAELLFDQGASAKWSCALDDGTNTYSVTAVQPVASTILTSLTAESNIAFCRLDDTSAKVPLKVSSSTTYKLTITLTGTTKIATNYLRSIGLFTATSNSPDRQMIDVLPSIGTLAVYGDYTTTKILDISANAITVNSDPSMTAKAATIYPYNSFDVTFTLKSSGFITAADNLIVIQFPTTLVSLTSPTITSSDVLTTDPLQVALKGTLTLKAFGTNAYYIDGIGEDIIPNRQFKLTIKNWKALDLVNSTQESIKLIVYYKNTYSVISYLSYTFLSVTRDVATLTANHPESWDVFRGGAFPITFTIKTTTDLSNGGWVVIQHTNYADIAAAAGNKVTFVPSTCDFSAMDSSTFGQGFGKRNNCYPLRPLDNTYTGSNGNGFFFFLPGPIALKNTYTVTIWTFFDICGGSGTAQMNVLGSTYSTQPTFQASIYKTIDTTKLNDGRFLSANLISQSVSTTFGQNCWNHPVFDTAAAVMDHWVDATAALNTATAVGAAGQIAILNYREVFDWQIFSTTVDNHSSITGTPWYQAPNAANLSASVSGLAYLYSATSANVIASGSFFLAAFVTPGTTGATAKSYLRTALPVVNAAGGGYTDHPPGRWYWQFPSKWFVAGNSYKSSTTPVGTCYCSWYMAKTGTATTTGTTVLATLSTGAINYGTTGAVTNTNPYFGANPSTGTATIDEAKSYAGGDSTKTGANAIFRIVSTYLTTPGTDRWYIAKYADVVAQTTVDPFNVAFFSSCFKWVSTMPTITSIYTAIDIQIKWNYTGTSGNPVATTEVGRTISTIRLIKLFPETGVFHDLGKNNQPGAGANPFMSHTVYTSSSQDAICLLELTASYLGTARDTASNTLALWIFGGAIFETDYNDVSATYPVAPLNSGITAYGLQSQAFSLDLSNPMAISGTNQTPILTFFTNNNPTQSLSAAAASIPWNSSSNYIWFMGSQIYLTGISSTFLSASADNNSNFMIPYYCPRFVTSWAIAAGGTPSVKTAHIFPLVMAAYLTMGGFNSINNLNTWVSYPESNTGANKYTKVFGNKWVTGTKHDVAKVQAVTAGLTAASVATLKWSPYTLTDTTQNYLYVYNGTPTAANAAAVTCTGHTLLISSLLTIDTSNPTLTGVTPSGGPNGYYPGAKTFYAFAKPFQKAHFYGLGTNAAPTTANMAAAIATGDTPSTAYYTNIKRPNVDAFVSSTGVVTLTDKIAYVCVPLNNDKNEVLTNYVANASATTGWSFFLDWYRNINANWATATSITWDKSDVYKSDPAANFKLTLTPPSSVPIGSTLKFTTSNSGSNVICGIVVTANYATNIVNQCTFSSNVVSCTAPATGNSFTVCCYNVQLSDPIAITAITATFGADAGITQMTSDVYTNPTANNSYFSMATTSTTNDILTTKNAAITSVTYTQGTQDAALGKITFTIGLPREPVRNMKVTISSSDLASLLIPNITPRCVASFVNNNVYGSSWDTGDALIDWCSPNNMANGSIVVTTKNIVYKCGLQFNKTLYVNLWPVVNVNWSTTQIANFKVNMGIGDTAIALSNTAATWTVTPALTTTKPLVVSQWDTLCAVSSVTPRIPGELADWTFDFDLLTGQASLGTASPNEVTIYFPFIHFGATISNLLCYSGTTLINCSFTDDGVLNIRFTSPLSIGKKTSITLVGVRNPALDNDISIACTVNNSNFATGVRTTLLTGSGKLAGGINTSAVTVNGALRLLQATAAVSDKNPRNTSIHKFRMSLDYAVGMTGTSVTIANTPVLHIYFPPEYRIGYFATKPTVAIDEFTADSNNNSVKTTTYTPASTVVSGNRVTVTFSQSSITLGTSFRFWDITVSGVVNPQETTVRTTAPITQTSRPYTLVLTATDAKTLLRTYSNTNSYSADILTTPIDANLQWNRGNSFVFDNTKWALDVDSALGNLNALSIKPGRYLAAFFRVKTNSSTAVNQVVNTITLTDTTFKTNLPSYSVATALNEPTNFWIGCACGTAPGQYLINFSATDTTNFYPLVPTVVTVDSSNKATISFNTPAAVPPAGSTWIQYFLSEPNFDTLNLSWTAPTGVTNDTSAKITAVTIAPATVTPSAFSSAAMSPVYSVFSVTSSSTTLPAQQFTTSDPNSCFSFGTANTISINISGTHTALTSVNLSTAFKYNNASTDATLANKNSVKFTFTPPVAPMYLFCALACFNMAYPADADIIAPKVPASNYIQFYQNIITSTSPIDIILNNLVRGMQYHMRCIAQSTQSDSTLVTTTSYNFENFPGTGVNATTVTITPTSATSTQCAQWQFLADPGATTKNQIVNYCQKVFSASGYSANGCVACTFSDMSYSVPGVPLPLNITCPATASKARLRFLQTTTNMTTTTTTNTTTPVTVTVCPIPHPICATDAITGKTYSDFFNQLTGDLKTSTLFGTNLNLPNLSLNTTNPIITVTDATTPDVTLLNSGILSSAATGAVSWTATFPTPLQCYWQIADASAAAPTFTQIQGCTDPSWCGKAKVGPTPTTISTSSLKAFTAGSNYNIYMACTNDIPLAQKVSNVRTVGSFNIATSGTTTNTNTTTTNTTTTNTTGGSSNFLSLSMMTIILLFAIIFN